MSSRQYTVTIKLKDGDGLLKKLDGLGGSGSPGGGSGGILGAGGDIFKRLEALGAGQLLKLAGIAGGVASLVTLTVKSSAILQGTMKLWETGMMLIFKPIGDFIGLALRPLTLALLQQLIIPFHKSVYPFFRDYGKKVGDALVHLLNPFGTGGNQGQAGKPALVTASEVFSTQMEVAAAATGLQIKKAFTDFGTSLSKSLDEFPTFIANKFLDFGNNVKKYLDEFPTFISNKFLDFGNDLGKYLGVIPPFITNTFLNFGNDVWNNIKILPGLFLDIFTSIGSLLANNLLSIPGAISDIFTGLASNITSKLAGVPSLIYNAIVGWLSSLGGLVPHGGSTGTTSPTSAAIRVQAIANTL